MDNFGFEPSDAPANISDVHGTFSNFPEQLSDDSKKTKIDEQLDKTLGNPLCGWFCLRPKFLQKFRTPKWALFWLCWAATMQGLVINGLINVVLTTIERRFGLRSLQTGLIAGGYDIASFLLLVPISYLGGRSNASKPRYIGVGVIVLGLGSLLFALPHYLAGPYRGGQRPDDVCQRKENESLIYDNDFVGQTEIEPYNEVYWIVFVIAQLLHGAGAAPLFTLGVTYVDENISKKMSSVYLGVYYTMAIIGPALGYVIGGELLKIYTDFLIVDSSTIGLTTDSNLWIGAWWLGFVVASIIFFIIAIPILAFPAILPGADELAKDRVSEAHQKSNETSSSVRGEGSKVRQLPRTLCALLRNPAFSMLNIAGASEGLLISGFAAFLPKFIENQFNVSASFAALLMGLLTVPAGGGGTFLGGYLIKRWNLPCSKILRFCLFVTMSSIGFVFCFILSCPNLDFAGLTVPYGIHDSEGTSLDDSCNRGCRCSRSEFNPICGVDGITYYSPCYAGCHYENPLNDIKTYTNCKCIQELALNMTNAVSERTVSYEAINTTCPSSCKHLWILMLLIFCNMFATFLCTMPALSATLRVVQEEQKSFALGIQWMKVRLLGTVPAPMIFGTLIDNSCILWHDIDNHTGACLVYDNLHMSRYMLGLALISKAVSLLFYFLAWWSYIPPNDKMYNQNVRQQTRTSVTNDTINDPTVIHTSSVPMIVESQ